MWHTLETVNNNITGALTNAFTAITGYAVQVISHLYMVLVRQQLIIGIQQLLYGLLWISMTILAIVCIRYIRGKKDWASLDRNTLILVASIVLLVSFITGSRIIIESLPRLLNPEYYAIIEGARILKEVRP